MKKNFMILTVLAAALVMLPCCKKDKNTSADENGAKYIIKAEMDCPNYNGGEKTHLGPTTDGQTPILWSANDHLALFDGENRYDFALENGTNTTSANFSCSQTPSETEAYCAFYPYDPNAEESLKPTAVRNGNDYTVTFNLPSEQTYLAPVDGNPTMGEGLLPMIAYATQDDRFTFRTMMAILKVDMKGTGTVRKLVLKDGNESAKLWGKASVTMTAANDTPELLSEGIISGGNNTLTLNCPNGVTLNETTATSFYFVVPVETLGENGKGFSIDVYNAKFKCYTIDKHTVSGNIMQRAIISTLAVDGVKVLREGALPGLFTVNEDGKKVCFSQGNLYYDGSKFCLENYQYSIASYWKESHVSNFYWSKTASAVYAEYYNNVGETSDVLFTNATETTPNASFTVNGQTGMWRTLSQAEWKYLFENHSYKYISVNTKYGIVIAPDGFSGEISDADVADWAAAEDAGFVFLPNTGFRENSYIRETDKSCIYWTSTPHETNSGNAYRMFFQWHSDQSYLDVKLNLDGLREWAVGIRLVTDCD